MESKNILVIVLIVSLIIIISTFVKFQERQVSITIIQDKVSNVTREKDCEDIGMVNLGSFCIDKVIENPFETCVPDPTYPSLLFVPRNNTCLLLSSV